MQQLIRLFVVLVLTVLVDSCALFQKEPLAKVQLISCANPNPTVTTTCNQVVDVLEKTNLLVASINTAIDDKFNAKLLTKVQAQGFRDKTKQADKELDSVLDSIKNFNFSTALTQANATKFLLEALDKELAAQIAKGQQ